MSSSSPAPESWISAFCALVGHEYFAEVSEDFIEDDFNLTGLQSQVPMYKEALEMILDVEPEDVTDEEDEEEEEEDEDEDDDEMQDDGAAGYRRAAAAADRRHIRMASDLSVIESSAEMLYGLIHQRFITSRAGIQQMAEKFELSHFGFCPRVHCHGAKVLPVGCSDIPGQETVKLFCASCLDVYTPPNSRFQTVDGAFFGTTFGCLFFMTFPEMNVGGVKPAVQQDPPASSSNVASSSANPHNGGSTNGFAHSNSNASRSLSSSLTSQPQQQQNPPSQQTTHNQQASLPPQPSIINGVLPKNLAPGLGPTNVYEPRIYGFRVSELAKTGPRMKWLRSRPTDLTELDESRLWAQTLEAQQARLRAQRGGQQQQQHQQQVRGDDEEMVDGDLAREGGDEEVQFMGPEDKENIEDEEEEEDAEEEEEDAGVPAEEDLNAPEGAAAAEVREIAAARKKGNVGSPPPANTSTTTSRRRTTAEGLTNGNSGGTAVRVGDGG